MKESEAKYQVSIKRYNPNKNGWYRCTDCDYKQNSRFANREFYVVFKDGRYFVCVGKNDELYSVYFKDEVVDGEKYYPGEIFSIFRKEYLKRGITQEMLDLFLNNPLEYRTKYQTDKPVQK